MVDCNKNKEMCNKAVDNYHHALEFVPECYKTHKMCGKAVNTYHSTIKLSLNALWLKKRVINSLRNSGAQDVCNKMPRWFQISIPQKKLLKTQWKPLYITLAMALAYFGYGLIFQHLRLLVLPKFFTYNSLEQVKRITIFFSSMTLLWFLCVSLL